MRIDHAIARLTADVAMFAGVKKANHELFEAADFMPKFVAPDEEPISLDDALRTWK